MAAHLRYFMPDDQRSSGPFSASAAPAVQNTDADAPDGSEAPGASAIPCVICPNSARLRVLISSAVCANFSYGFLCKPTQNFPASVQQENGALPILCHVFPQSFQIALHQRHIGLSPCQFLRGDVVAAVEHGGSGPCGLRNGVRHQMVGKLDIPDGGDML